ncbi:3'-5' exonuclease [Thauera chlorobenzoica]|uniref:Exodeoxyribonuclease VIII n=1 Tax=Thauera chlorobenzoica TaxID=96773 RepID=A0A1H5Z123_9RHOO|nr:3'-5' exonuclease [Thauera chlorobenzoica]APR05679.1 Exodeoxyribonuclease VIII [Thauera chlorobenzoica]SEG30031.1 exodeoxyribonuclease VIII [Thauera chlorobenzoica]
MGVKIYTNVMLDLETMGNGPDAAIVAIGAIAFDLEAGELGPGYYNRVDLESAVQDGGVIDASTVTWWLQQGDEARQEIARAGGLPIAVALASFAEWMGQTTIEAEVWGNGASFDNVILRSAYQRGGQPAPWAWWNDRCYRTVKAQRRHVPFERIGTHHNALSDATSQALHLIKMLRPSAFISGEPR